MSFFYRLGVKPGYRSKMKPWNAVTVKKNTVTYCREFSQ